MPPSSLSEKEQRILDIFDSTLLMFVQEKITPEALRHNLNLVFERNDKNPNLQLSILNLLLRYTLMHHNVREFCKNEDNFADENWQMVIDHSQLLPQPGLTRFELLMGMPPRPIQALEAADSKTATMAA